MQKKPSLQQIILDEVRTVKDDTKRLHEKFDLHVTCVNNEISSLKERTARSEGFIKILVGVFMAAIGTVASIFAGFWHK